MLDKWMAEFHYLLTYSNTALAESDVEKESVVDAVKAAVCENINLFIQINEDEFEKYLKTFAQDVWTQLSAVSLNPGQAGPPLTCWKICNMPKFAGLCALPCAISQSVCRVPGPYLCVSVLQVCEEPGFRLDIRWGICVRQALD